MSDIALNKSAIILRKKHLTDFETFSTEIFTHP